MSVYCLDPRGLSTGTEEAIALSNSAVLLPDAAKSKHGIDMLSSLGRIVEESSHHYILGYDTQTRGPARGGGTTR